MPLRITILLIRFVVGWGAQAVASRAPRAAATAEQGSDPYSYEKPTHQVTLSSFHIGKSEVTQELWEAVMDKSVSEIASENRWNTYGVGSNYPMYLFLGTIAKSLLQTKQTHRQEIPPAY
ncbi:MAG: SUMF1/EgtB/PvdO family nonheme iron enzyme [Sodaliphilus sp.]